VIVAVGVGDGVIVGAGVSVGAAVAVGSGVMVGVISGVTVGSGVSDGGGASVGGTLAVGLGLGLGLPNDGERLEVGRGVKLTRAPVVAEAEGRGAWLGRLSRMKITAPTRTMSRNASAAATSCAERAFKRTPAD
jgi:hypothetical protein